MESTSRKRRRTSDDCPIPGWEGDTIEVAPYRPPASKPPIQPLSTEAGTDTNKVHRTRTDRDTKAEPDPLQHGTAASSSAKAGVDRPAPQGCCSYCFTCGGSAVYQCFTRKGEELCMRCIRDNQTECHLPNSDNPPHRDREQSGKKPKLEQQPVRRYHTRQSNSTVPAMFSRDPKTNRGDYGKTKTYNNAQESKECGIGAQHDAEEDIHVARSESMESVAQSHSLPFRQQKHISNTDQSPLKPIVEVSVHSTIGPDNQTSSSSDGLASCATSHAKLKERPRRRCAQVSYLENFEVSMPGEDENVHGVRTKHGGSKGQVAQVSSPEEALDSGDDCSMLPEKPLPTRANRHGLRSRQSNKIGEFTRARKSVDLSLPPLSSIEECMSHMAAKAVELGLLESLGHLKGRPIRIATMCSGTEAPLLALDLISKALEKKGHQPIRFQQEFSAEIEVMKQAFIERNFHPKILFRDVRDFLREGTTTARTAYGAEVEIPILLHMLIAGFVCRDLSRMNNQGKTLDDGGESGDTWLAVYTYVKRFHPSIVLLENVKSEKATWEDVVLRWNEIGYEAAWVFCDTKNYYLPQTRERMYMVAINRSHFGKGVGNAVSQWKDTMQKLQRQCSSPYEAFLPKSLTGNSRYSPLKSEVDWALCKLRNDHIRSEKKLGILSPVSRRSPNGAVMPPDFADRKFYNSQSSRVHDAIDIAHLENAQKGCDSLYKMALWDVTQNVDRFRIEPGIAPCLTPGGQDFASNLQRTLNGSELMLLQGMPLENFLFANESQKDLQNLAGNAMSTTVIGASLISVLISGSEAFRFSSSTNDHETPANDTISPKECVILQPNSIRRTILELQTCRELDLNELRRDAKLSDQMCVCEGKHLTSQSEIRTCSACGHSACKSCAGNPKHVYEEKRASDFRRRSPHEFINRWRPELPARLQFEFPSIDRFACETAASDPVLGSYLDVLSEAQNLSQHFCIENFIREHQYWSITYTAPLAWLELRFGPKLEWLVFLRCPPNLPGDDPLRGFLKSPIAHGIVGQSLFDVNWKARFPRSKDFKLRMSGSKERAPSWRNKLGLQDYKEETVPLFLEVQINGHELTAITGKYQHLPHCGTASNSLYKRLSDDRMFLFLDPDPIGIAAFDSFVFSGDHSKKHFGDSRIILASVDPSWRPWHIEHEGTHTVNASTTYHWLPVALELQPACVSLDVGFLDEQFLSDSCIPECSHALAFLNAVVHSSVDVKNFSWVLERPRSLPMCSSWQPIDPKNTGECSCAPPYPELTWSVNEKGVATAHEDRRAAATFERSIKQSPSVFHLEVSRNESGTRIQVALNVMSLVHRARRRLSGLDQAVKTSWRLVTDHTNLPPLTFVKFKLRSNASDTSKTNGVAPIYLRGVQLRSLQWMGEQEVGKKITLVETEEAIHQNLGWRVEARAETEQLIRGGVLADQPSFGKTVATIGLIQNEFNTETVETLLRKNQSSATSVPGLLDSIATLVVCPPHIAQQWRSELAKFLPTEQFKSYNILVIESYADLQTISIEKLLASRVVVVSWTMFSQEEYLSALAHFVALPEPDLASRRGIEAWMKRATKEIPSQLRVCRSHDYAEFERLTEELIDKRLQHPEFMATLPLKVQHGSAYQSFSTIQSAENIEKAPEKPKEKTKTNPCLLPLLHLFQFNRIVVDEYHYLIDTRKTEMNVIATAIKNIAAHKRWLLSGTPALANFSDVNQIASFLGISLGRYCLGDGSLTGSIERSTSIDHTDFESFIVQTEVLSRQWHEARHMRAQQFLDDFVRQNEAELEHIPCVENLVPVSLDAAHHAVYVELSQHLISQRMQIKKINKKSSSDRVSRLNDSLENSANAEEALLKSALFFQTNGESGLSSLLQKRSKQLQSTRSELIKLLSGFKNLMLVEKKRLEEANTSAEQNITDLYNHFKKDISIFNWLGDQDTSKEIGNLLVNADTSPALGFPELVTAKNEQRSKLSKQRLSQLREVSLEYVHIKRSERFVQSIRDHLQIEPLRCSSPSCAGTAEQDLVYLIPHCGHTACRRCLELRLDDERCVHPGCAAYTTDANLIRMADLGSDEDQAVGESFGRKIDTIINLVKNVPNADQVIVFAPNEEIVSILERVFKHANISYLSPSRNKRSASAKVLEEFKANKNLKTRKRVLILNLGSESAAGANLTNANHIIFVSPLLAKSQYEYESAMAQAIARSRRYGQEKKVHIYHVVAQRTIDVDIIEHHQRWNDAITIADATIKMPNPSSSRKERTKLVKNRKGEMMLVPRSWLTDLSKWEALDIGESTDTFTSLISFSDTFEREDDEEEG